MGTLFYDATIQPASTTSEAWVAIPGLQIDVPPGFITGTVTAVVTLNVPAPYAIGSNYPGINFSLWQVFQESQELIASGAFTSSFQNPHSAGRNPFTLMGILPIQAQNTPCSIVAKWQSIRGSTCVIDNLGYPGASMTCLIESTPGA